jgi:uncharacterized protein (DUF58 family)
MDASASISPPRSAPDRPGRYFDPAVLARISNLTLRARHVVEGIMAGLHRSALRGLSVEFSEHRAYAPGDELRRIDWKLFGRQDRVFVKEYEAETNLRAHLVVDATASMGYAGAGAAVSKLEYAATVAASLAYLMLLQRDAVGLVLVGGDGVRVVPPRAQPHHLHALIAELEGARAGGRASLREALAQAAAGAHRRGLFVLISDLLDDPGEIELGLKHLHHRRNDVMVVHVADRDEIDLPFRALTLFRDLETPAELLTDPREIRAEYRAAFEEHLAAVRDLCRRNGADYDLFPTDQPLDRALVRYLARRGG